MKTNAKVVIENPLARFGFLKFKVGWMESRPMVVPVYSGVKFITHNVTTQRVQVFRLLGYGETLEDAERMAAKHFVTESLTPKTQAV